MTQAVQAELERRDNLGNLVYWLLVADALNTVTGLSDPVIEYGLRAKLDTLLAKDFATETTLSEIGADIDTIETNSTTLAGKDFATQTTLLTLLSQSDFDAKLATLQAAQNPLDKYKIADEDSLSATKYYGFTTTVSASTNWIILQEVVGATVNTYRYANNSNNAGAYTTKWTNRATLAYDYLYNLTGV